MKRKIKDMSLLKKLTFTYVIFVLIPLFMFFSFVYGQGLSIYRDRIINDSYEKISLIKSNIMNKMEIINDTSGSIIFNEEILNFLQNTSDFHSHNFQMYGEKIYPIINYVMLYDKQNIWKIRIFMNNTTIPEGWGSFLNIHRISDKDWYKEFISLDERETWLRLNGKSYFTNSFIADVVDKDQFIYVRKIMDLDNSLLGVLTIEMLDKDLILPDIVGGAYGNNLFILHNDTVLYADNEIEDYFTSDSLIKSFREKNSSFELERNLFVYDTIDKLNIKIGVMNPIHVGKGLENTLTISLFTITIITLILVFIFYIYIQSFIKSIRKYMGIMEKAIKGDFSIRIPINSMNEIGVIGNNFNFMIGKIDNLIKEIVKREIIQKKTQLSSLQHQINPHFFYNTLDILAGKMVLDGNYETADIIAEFGKVFRYNLDGESTHTTIRNEIRHVRSYLKIQEARYKDKIRLVTNIPDAILDMKIIKFILQPIVENSIMHGSFRKGILEITIDMLIDDEDNIRVIITDNGVGMAVDDLDKINKCFLESDYLEYTNKISGGIGLKNINERLKLFYGNNYFIRMESIKDKYTKVIFSIPYD